MLRPLPESLLRSSAPSLLARALLSSALLAPAALAQTGPFTPGELLVRAPSSGSTLDTLYRIDPVTGDGAPLVTEVFPNYSTVGWLAFDPWRNRVLYYGSLADFGVFEPRLFSIAGDGSVRDLGFDSADVTSLAPTGDGRVYLYADEELFVLQPDDSVAPVLDENGLPIDVFFDHLAWNAADDTLIGAASQSFDASCFQIWHLHAQRFPMDASGTQLRSPATCVAHSYGPGGTHYATGLDPLPSGNFLVPMSNADFASQEVFYELDPFTLALSLWSSSTLSNIDGGVWSEATGLAYAIQDDNQSDVLRSFSAGQGGSGNIVTVNVPVGSGLTGQGPGSRIYDVDPLGLAPCTGESEAVGTGLAGSGGFIPGLHVVRCPRVGETFELVTDDLLGQTGGLLFIGLTQGQLPVLGGTLYSLPPYAALLPFVADGTAGQAGAGRARLTIPVPQNPQLVGLTIVAQVGVVDAQGPEGAALSGAQAITLGG